MKQWLEKFKTEHETLYQLVSFTLFSLIASAVELASFALFRWVVFRELESVEFRWFVFDYSAQNGGLDYFISIALSFLCGQIVNFFVQRSLTFHSTVSAARSAPLYLVMIALMWLLQMWLPTVIRAPIAAALGATAGDMVVKLLCMTSGLLIAFPINKFVIMKKE